MEAYKNKAARKKRLQKAIDDGVRVLRKSKLDVIDSVLEAHRKGLAKMQKNIERSKVSIEILKQLRDDAMDEEYVHRKHNK